MVRALHKTNRNTFNIAFVLLFLTGSMFLTGSVCFGQKFTRSEKQTIDSLNVIITENEVSDTTLASAYLGLSEILYVHNVDTVLVLCEKAISICRENLGRAEIGKAERNTFSRILAGSLNNIGYVYYRHGDVKNSQKYYYESLTIEEELNNKEGIATSMANMGLIYLTQGDTAGALDYFTKCLVIEQEIGNKHGIATIMNNLGTIYSNMDQWKVAIQYYHQSLEIDRTIQNREGIATSLNNIGILYSKLGIPDTALLYFSESLAVAEALDDQPLVATVLSNIAEVHWNIGEVNEAKVSAEKALRISTEMGIPDNIGKAARILSYVAEKENRHREALEMYQLHVQMVDSISNSQTRRETIKMQTKHEYEQKHLRDSLRNAEQKRLADLQHTKTIREKNIITYSVVAVLTMAIVFLVFVYNRLKVTRKQKQIIEETNEQIVSSINYAKHIQTALLKSEEYVTQSLPPHFVLFLPKDIVSGDFYWLLEKENFMYLAVADCTGHGVPGAFLTMLGTSFLNEILSVKDTIRPSDILNELRDKFIKELSQTGKRGENLDGMDISLIRLNRQTLEAEWAGANNPLYIVHPNGTFEMIKGDKQAIGFNTNPQPFQNHAIQLKEGDAIYLFSDGYADQFGGPGNRKFGYKRLQEMFLKCAAQSMEEQKRVVTGTLKDWIEASDEERIDDVCVIGMRITKITS